MPWVHEDLTTESAVMKHFPAATKYAGTNAGYNRFKKDTKWDSYPQFSNESGGAAWRLEKKGGCVRMYSKSAGPYSAGRAFTRDALTWFGDGMIQMSLPYRPGSHNANEYMIPNGDDANHKIGVAIQFWASQNPKECVRFFLGLFRPVRKWNQGGFWKTLLVKIGSELIGNINSMVETSQKEITDLKKKHDKDIADKNDKINELTLQIESLSTETLQCKDSNKRLREDMDNIRAQYKDLSGKLQKVRKSDTPKDAIMVVQLVNKMRGLRDHIRKEEEAHGKTKEDLQTAQNYSSRQSKTLRKHNIPASQLEPASPPKSAQR